MAHLTPPNDLELLEMEHAGILDEDELVELLYGRIVPLTYENPPHAQATRELFWNLTSAFDSVALVGPRHSLRLSLDPDDDHIPIPDMLLLDPKDYADLPLPEDVYLLIEVSDTTLRKDRGVKLPLYALSGIPEVWVVNLVDKHIEVYTEPRGRDYWTRRTVGLTQAFAPQRFPERAQAWLSEGFLKLLE